MRALADAFPAHAAKMTSITNGYDPEPFASGTASSPPLSGPTIEIIHTGEIYANRSPGPFLDAIGRLEAASRGGKELRVRFIGKISSARAESEMHDEDQ